MAISEAKSMNSVDRYIEEIRSIWGDGKNPQLPSQVKDLMERLFVSTDPEEPWIAELIREGKPAKELYRDPVHGFIQMGHVHGQGHKSTPHDHGPCWVVYGSYSGVTDITTYRRADDGKEPGKVKLEVKEVHRLSPGVAHPYLPGDIHAPRAVETPAVVFRFLSYDLEKIERHRYNLETGAVTRV
ncbi:MAG: hypothetical protein ACREP8_07090 [Candidatus Binatia bacterium]